MKYELNRSQQYRDKTSMLSTIKKFLPMMVGEKTMVLVALLALLVNTGASLAAPIIIGITIDNYILTKNYQGVLINAAILLIIFLVGSLASYIQTKTMGGVGQRLLFTLRNSVFHKLQELPLAFFNQNKTGDLISRINSDTDNLNQFFSQALLQFMGNLFLIIGAAFFILIINYHLGIPALLPAIGVFIFTKVVSGWVKQKNTTSLQSVGNMSAEIQENLTNFKVIVAFNRHDYFRKRFHEVNQKNYSSAISAGIANNIFTPIYGFASNIAQLIVLFYGLYLITTGQFAIGLLISYFTYLTRFYDPIRHIAGFWASFQLALASWERIAEILALTSDMPITTSKIKKLTTAVLSFRNVTFGYQSEEEILHDVSFDLHPGKTYAFVGPTGGGKTTTASLMARLYDPGHGTVLLNGIDIRSYNAGERTKRIGFILQEPYLFHGTVKDNLLYGNDEYAHFTDKQMLEYLHAQKLDHLLERFDKGLQTPVASQGETISLGQRQLIAFIRAVLRHPDLLILDEATANIDTVTEELLETIIQKLPSSTTKVIIAHRLNTIENADEIFFVNSGNITKAGSFDQAVSMLLQEKRVS